MKLIIQIIFTQKTIIFSPEYIVIFVKIIPLLILATWLWGLCHIAIIFWGGNGKAYSEISPLQDWSCLINLRMFFLLRVSPAKHLNLNDLHYFYRIGGANLSEAAYVKFVDVNDPVCSNQFSWNIFKLNDQSRSILGMFLSFKPIAQCYETKHLVENSNNLDIQQNFWIFPKAA